MEKDVRVSFRLKVGRDDDLISWFESLADNDRSYFIRETLRGYLIKGTPPVSPSTVSSMNNNATSTSKNVNKPVGKSKSIAEISEAELEKNLRGWMD